MPGPVRTIRFVVVGGNYTLPAAAVAGIGVVIVGEDSLAVVEARVEGSPGDCRTDQVPVGSADKDRGCRSPGGDRRTVEGVEEEEEVVGKVRVRER